VTHAQPTSRNPEDGDSRPKHQFVVKSAERFYHPADQ
jgi:hypothetical protein